jgi:RNA polymerase sigma factor (sigma-70 family)
LLRVQADDLGALDRHRAAADLFAGHAAAIRAAARRVSLCADDADDACQRALLILLTKAPPLPPGALLAWMRVVTRREALAVRRARERLLAGSPDDVVEWLPCERPQTPERIERRETTLECLAALAELKPDESRAIVLQASGYSYAEIGELMGWTHTKVNRCLAEGRVRLRELRATT